MLTDQEIREAYFDAVKQTLRSQDERIVFTFALMVELEAVAKRDAEWRERIGEPVAYMAVDEINGDYMLEREPDSGIQWTPLYAIKETP